MNRNQQKAMFARGKPIREYKKQKDRPSGKTSGWHRNINVTGTIAERLRGGNESRALQQEAHFARCELKYPLKDCQEDREHLFAKSIAHNYDKRQSEKGRTKYECVFCGTETKDLWNHKERFEKSAYGKIVEDVPNSELVRKEAKIRNVPLRHYEVGQEKGGLYG